MSKADEMFNELGYRKYSYQEGKIIDYDYRKGEEGKTIAFYLIEKSVTADVSSDDVVKFTVQELEAINEKVKELGWLDE